MSDKDVVFAVGIFNFMVVTTILSYFGFNPIQWLAPDGGMSLESLAFITIAGIWLGWFVKSLHALPRMLGGSFLSKIVVGILITLRGVFYGPALIVIAPFVAWRILLISLAICVGLALLSTGIDLVRPPVPAP